MAETTAVKKRYEIDVEYDGKLITIETDTPSPDPAWLRGKLKALLPQYERSQSGPTGTLDPVEPGFIESLMAPNLQERALETVQPAIDAWKQRKRHPEPPAGEAQQRQMMGEMGQYPDDDFMYEEAPSSPSYLGIGAEREEIPQAPLAPAQAPAAPAGSLPGGASAPPAPQLPAEEALPRYQEPGLLEQLGGWLPGAASGAGKALLDEFTPGAKAPQGPPAPGITETAPGLVSAPTDLMNQIGDWMPDSIGSAAKSLLDEFTPGALAPQGPPLPGIFEPELGDEGTLPPHPGFTPPASLQPQQPRGAEIPTAVVRPSQTVDPGRVVSRIINPSKDEALMLRAMEKRYPQLGYSTLVAMRESSLQPWKMRPEGDGDWSYGLYAFKGKNMAEFVDQYLKANHKAFYNILKQHRVNTPEFNRVFERLAREDPEGLGEMMRQFAEIKFFKPAFHYFAQRWGIKEDEIPLPMKEALASVSIHHGRWKRVIDNMEDHLKDFTKAPWEERLRALYKSRRAYVNKIDFSNDTDLPAILKRYDFEERYTLGGLRQLREPLQGAGPAGGDLATSAQTGPAQQQQQLVVHEAKAITQDDIKHAQYLLEIWNNPDLSMEAKQWYMQPPLTDEQKRWQDLFHLYQKWPGVWLADKITFGLTSELTRDMGRAGADVLESFLNVPGMINASSMSRRNNLINIMNRFTGGLMGMAAQAAQPYADMAARQMNEIEEGLRTERPPNFFNKLGEAMGSYGMVFIPGLGAQALAARIAFFTPRLAALAGATTYAVNESILEASDIYKSMKDVVGEQEAAIRANKVLGYNLIWNMVLNAVGADPVGRGLHKLVKAGAMEGIQEAIQYDLSRRAFWVPKNHPNAEHYKRWGWTEGKDSIYMPFSFKNAGEAALIGTLLGMGGKSLQGDFLPDLSAFKGQPPSQWLKVLWDPSRVSSPGTAVAAVPGGVTTPIPPPPPAAPPAATPPPAGSPPGAPAASPAGAPAATTTTPTITPPAAPAGTPPAGTPTTAPTGTPAATPATPGVAIPPGEEAPDAPGVVTPPGGEAPPDAVTPAPTTTTSIAPADSEVEGEDTLSPAAIEEGMAQDMENVRVTWTEKDGTVREGTVGSDVSGRMVRVNLDEGGWTSVRRDQLTTADGQPLPEQQALPIQGPDLISQQDQMALMAQAEQTAALEAQARAIQNQEGATTPSTITTPEITTPEGAQPDLPTSPAGLTPEQTAEIERRSFDGDTAGSIADLMDLDIEQVWEARDQLGIPKNKRTPEYGKWKRDYQARQKTAPTTIPQPSTTPAVTGGEVTTAGPPPETTALNVTPGIAPPGGQAPPTVPAGATPPAQADAQPPTVRGNVGKSVTWDSSDGPQRGMITKDKGTDFVQVTLDDGSTRTVRRDKLHTESGEAVTPGETTHTVVDDTATSPEAEAAADQAVEDLSETVSTPQMLVLNGEAFEVQPDGTVILERNVDDSEVIEKAIREGMIKMVGQRVSSPEDLAVLAQMIRDARFENLYVVYVDADGKIVSISHKRSGLPGVVHGGLNLDQVAQEMTAAGAAGFWIIHNHPSGNPTPSDDDVASTKEVDETFPGLLQGHVVIDTGYYGSIGTAKDQYAVRVPQLPSHVESPHLTRPSALIPDVPSEIRAGMMGRMARQLQLDGFGVVFYLETFDPPGGQPRTTQVKGVQLVPMDALKSLDGLRGILRQGARTFGGSTVVLHTFKASSPLKEMIRQSFLHDTYVSNKDKLLHGHIDHQGDRFASAEDEAYEIYDARWHGMPRVGDKIVVHAGTGGVIDANVVAVDAGGIVHFTSKQRGGVWNIHTDQVVGISRAKGGEQDGSNLVGSGPLPGGQPPSGESGGDAAATGYGGSTGADADVRPPVDQVGGEGESGGVRPGTDAEADDVSGRDAAGVDAGETTPVPPQDARGRGRSGRRGGRRPGRGRGPAADVTRGRGGDTTGDTSRESDADGRDVSPQSQPGSRGESERPTGDGGLSGLTGEEAARQLLGMTPEELAAFMAEGDAPLPAPAPKKKAAPRKQGGRRRQTGRPKNRPAKQPRSKTPLTPEQRRERYKQELEQQGLGEFADDLSELRDIFGAEEGPTLSSPPAGLPAPTVPRHLQNQNDGYDMGVSGEARTLNLIFRAEPAEPQPASRELLPSVDPKLYERALPAMTRMYNQMIAGGGTLGQFRDTLKAQMGAKATPYLTQFVMDLQKGLIDLNPPAPPRPPAAVTHVPAAIELADTTDGMQGLYVPYQHRLMSTGAKAHPGKLVESASLASVDPPPLTYQPNLPADVIARGAVSQPQIDEIAATGQVHNQWLPADRSGVSKRRGRLIGDGPGTGKTHVLLGIMMDNQRQGRTQAIVISMKNDLFADMRDIWRDQFGGKPREEFRSIAHVKLEAPIDPTFKGTMLATYRMLQQKGRVQQLIDWVGKDFEGVLLFDEAHAAGNNIGARPSKSAQVMRALDKALPKARIVYASATSASHVKGMGYAERLGLWGEGTDFADARQFASRMRNAGLATLEQIARDMKAMGVLGARTLDWSDVNVSRLRHPTQPDQQAAYDFSSEIWKQVHQGLKTIITAMQRDFGVKATQPLTKGLWQRHHGVVQQFYQQVLAGMQMPTVIASVQADLDAGRSPVIQLAQTYETQQDRGLENLPVEEIQSHRFTAASLIEDYLKEHWPVYTLETYNDENHQPQVRIKENDDGSPVIDELKVAQRDALIYMARNLNELLPLNPLDQLLDAFGEDLIAEVTGRSSRILTDPATGLRTVQKRKKSDVNADSAAFRDGRKPILVYTSAKAGTGFSFHSGMNFGNQRQRAHYILETGWDPLTFYQSLNRTHRSNQAGPPVIYLVDTDVPGHQRIISTMAKGLQNLGALTLGERGALAQGSESAQGLFSQRDNLESREAEDALAILYTDILNFGLQGMDPDTFKDLSGFDLNEDKPSMTQFLNRMLAMPIEQQRLLYGALNTRLDGVITDAIQSGTMDVGMERLSADTTEIVEEHHLSTYRPTGADTSYVKLRRFNKVYPMAYGDLLTRLDRLQMDGSLEGDGDYLGMVKAPRGKIYAAVTSHPRTDVRSGERTDMVRLIAADGDETRITLERFNEIYQLVETDEATAWDQAIAELPPYKKSTTHLITGLLLPYWNLLGEGQAKARHRVVQVWAEQGGQKRRLLGRVIPQMHMANLLTQFGVLKQDSFRLARLDYSPSEVYENLSETDGAYLRLDSGAYLSAALDVADRPVITVSYLPQGQVHVLAQMGVRFEQTPFGPLGQLPAGPEAVRIISALMDGHTIQEAVQFRSPESTWIQLSAPPAGPSPSHPTNKSGYRKDVSSAETASRLDSWLAEPYAKPGTPPAGAPTTQAYTSSNPHIEAFMTKNKQRQQRGLMARAHEAYETKKNQIAREFEHLPNTGFFMPARDQLLKLNNQLGVSVKTAIYKIGNLYRSLTPEEYDIVSRLIVMEDALENMNIEDEQRAEQSLPPRVPQGLGWSRQNIEAEIVTLKGLVTSSPAMAQAIEKRKQAWDELKLAYIEGMLSIGVDVSEKFSRDAYFRHWVQDMAQGMGVNRSVQQGKLEAQRNPSYLRRRGEQFKAEMTDQGLVVTPTYDYATDLVMAEFEVMSKMLYHTQVAATLRFVQEHYDLRPELEMIAMRENDAHVLEHFRKVADAINAQKGPLSKMLSAEDVMRVDLGRDLAIAFGRLFELAQAGALPSAPQFDDLIDAMAEVYITREHAQTEAEANARLPNKYLPQLFTYMNWVMGLKAATPDIQESQSAVGQWFKARQKREDKIEAAIQAEGAPVLTWEDIAQRSPYKETYQRWQAVHGAVFYLGYTVPEQIAEQLLEGHVQRLGIDKTMLRRAMIRGQQRREMVLPNELALTLDRFARRLEDGFWNGPINAWTRGLKIWTLNTPKRYFEVQARNASGDIEVVLAANPKILAYAPQAMKDLYHAFILQEGMKGDLLFWHQQGGLVSTFNQTELADVDYLHEVMGVVGQGPQAGLGAVARWQQAMKEVFSPGSDALSIKGAVRRGKAIWKSMKDLGDFREHILRYAAYLHSLEDIRSHGGKPTFYGASIRAEIDGLQGNPQAQAWHIANSLLGAYDRVGVAGQEARKFVLWFWSFQELNLRRYTRLFMNALEDDQLAAAIGRKLAAKALNPMAYVRIGKVFLGAHALMGASAVWNFLFFHDEEQELPPYVRERPHLIFGRNSDGTIRVMTRLGSFADYASWFGLDAPQTTIQRLRSNTESPLQVALDSAMSPLKNLAGALNPTIKLPAEVLSGQKWFPDPFEPRPMRSRLEHVMQGFGLEDIYSWGSGIFGRTQPGTSIERSLFDALGNSYEPNMGLIGEARDLERKFLKSIGQAPPLLVYTPKNNALWAMKKALRMGDSEGAHYWLMEYFKAGGTRQGIKRSMQAGAPMGSMSDKERARFLSQLTPRERQLVARALHAYYESLAPSATERR